jgi:hypothetical protein
MMKKIISEHYGAVNHEIKIAKMDPVCKTIRDAPVCEPLPEPEIKPIGPELVTRDELEAFRAEILRIIYTSGSEPKQEQEPEKIINGNCQKIKETRNRWMASEGEEKPRMYEIFGSGYVRVWNMIRTLAITIVEQGNAHELDEFSDGFAAMLIEDIATLVESCRKEYIKSGRAKNVGRAYADQVDLKASKFRFGTNGRSQAAEEERQVRFNSLSDKDFKQFFTRWAVQHHVIVYPDMRRAAMMESFNNYYRINTGDLNEVMRELFGEGDKK